MVPARQAFEELHTVLLLSLTSGGQSLEDPVQYSAGSQSLVVSTVDLQIVEEFILRSAGQREKDPLQVSAISHVPLDARQVMPASTNLHVMVQHEVGSPLLVDPRSHSSELATTPSPHTPEQSVSSPVQNPLEQLLFVVQLL